MVMRYMCDIASAVELNHKSNGRLWKKVTEMRLRFFMVEFKEMINPEQLELESQSSHEVELNFLLKSHHVFLSSF